MHVHSLWTKLFGALRGVALVSRPRRKRRNAKQAHKAAFSFYELENEGENPGPRPQARDEIVTTGSA